MAPIQLAEPGRPAALSRDRFGFLPARSSPIRIGVLSDDCARGILARTAGAEESVKAVRLAHRGGRQDCGHRLELSAGIAAELHRFVARFVANLADAADIAQQTLLLACAELSTCRGENLSPWLFAIARHLIVDHYRAQNRFRFVEVVAALEEAEPALQTPADAVLAAGECRERLRSLLDFITRGVCLEHQVAVLLADVYGHRDKHSAAVLRMSVPCFKLLLHGARARLREIVGGSRMPVSKTSSAACDESANGHGSKKAERGNGGLPSLHPAYRRLGVTCRLGAPEFLALREKLLEDLKL